MLHNINPVKIVNPIDIIISQIRELIISGKVKPGEKLPPERKLAEQLAVSRGQVREAINKLAFYGILKVMPQSGTIVTGMGVVALENLITDILKLEKSDFKSLVETRIILEMEATKIAALRRTDKDIEELRRALLAYTEKVEIGENAVEEDLMYHLKIAEASKNAVLKTLMMIITPDIVKSFKKLKICDGDRNKNTVEEHEEIFNAILNRKPDQAAAAMMNHLRVVKEYSLQVQE